MLRRAVIMALALTAGPALAADQPATLALPTPLVAKIVRYLGDRPFREVAPLMGEIDACYQAQVRNNKGAIEDHGECPTVSAPPAEPKQ